MLTVWLEPKRLAFLNHAQVNFMLTVWLEPKRSARFYGQVCKTPCVGSRFGTAQGMQRS